jgi:hypothetical protein
MGEESTIFKWHTLKELSARDFKYRGGVVTGKVLEVELTSGRNVRVWRAENGSDYFCHGLTFGGKDAPSGPVSPFGDYVPVILQGHYEKIAERDSQPGDIVIWHGVDESDVVHSAVLTHPIASSQTDSLDYASRLQSKNGMLSEASSTLEILVENYYGESYVVYRKKET